MAKVNGTNLLVYCDGTVIATQTSCTVTWEQDLPGATTKASAGWEEHINGTRRASCDFDALFSTDGLSAASLIAKITGRSSVVLWIDVNGTPVVGEAKLKSFSINGPQEEAASCSGSFTFTGGAFMLAGANAQLFTDFDNVDYDTFTESGSVVASAVNASGDASALSDTINVTAGDRIKVITFLTLTSGQAPTVGIWDNTSAHISNTETLAAGVNCKTLVVTGSDSSASLRFSNSAAANWSTTYIYCFKS